MNVNIHESWKEQLQKEFQKTYFQELTKFVKSEYKNHKVYPRPAYILNAFEFSPFDTTKVIIIGQDPYHGDGQAHGLCFSVNRDVKIPPSLRNIYKEIHDDVGTTIPTHGNLEHWAKQGVLMLNATLTVRAHTPGSHQNKGWETFTDAVIQTLSDQKENLVFLLWGAYAQKKGSIIDTSKHLVLESAHPSPFAAHRGFFGNRHFSKTNQYLKEKGLPEIYW
ncbi:uracil-DNA glycosylase [Reichenbachiella agariperforans]|uniref:uracil-DNA glycosylase n=1 Tax=Reichenbachiella agariperforans TaxID=156994 RepID=UPI001C0949AD|nr:uracil-DNA glycosylase [Reichenbachiella agariperforans]MBU2913088.1 uracil-DNA glycosylase [Reichenbachiella agariperforans]